MIFCLSQELLTCRSSHVVKKRLNENRVWIGWNRKGNYLSCRLLGALLKWSGKRKSEWRPLTNGRVKLKYLFCHLIICCLMWNEYFAKTCQNGAEYRNENGTPYYNSFISATVIILIWQIRLNGSLYSNACNIFFFH